MQRDHEVQMDGLRSTIQLLQLDVEMLKGLVGLRRSEHKALALKHIELEVHTNQPCVLDHQDWKKRVCNLELKIDRLKAHLEHWHMTELRAAIENLRVQMVEDRRGGMHWLMRGDMSVGGGMFSDLGRAFGCG